MIRLLTPWPAMLVEGDERMLLASDFHLGIEYELAKMGINIPYQTERFLGELLGLVREHRPDRLLLLGDVKHGVPITSFQEQREQSKAQKRELRRLEREEEQLLATMEQLDEEGSRLEHLLAEESVYRDGERVREIKEQLEAITNRRERLMSRWESVDKQRKEI